MYWQQEYLQNHILSIELFSVTPDHLLIGGLMIGASILILGFAGSAFGDFIRPCTQPSQNWDDSWNQFERKYERLILHYLLKEFRKYAGGVFSNDDYELIRDFQQDVYIRLLKDDCKALKRFKGETAAAFSAFLFAICRNLVSNHFKRKKTRTEFSFSKIEQTTKQNSKIAFMPDPGSDETENALEFDILKEHLISILRRNHRSRRLNRDIIIFRLFHFEGMTSREISEIENIDLEVDGIETVLHRMRVTIRKFPEI